MLIYEKDCLKLFFRNKDDGYNSECGVAWP